MISLKIWLDNFLVFPIIASVGFCQEKNKTLRNDLRGTSLVPFEEIFARAFSEK